MRTSDVEFFGTKFDRKYSVVLILEHGGTESTWNFVSYVFLFLYCYVRSVLYILFSSCQLALFGYPDWGVFRAFS